VVVYAAACVGLIWLAVAFVWFMGPLGVIPWLLCYGLFRSICKGLLFIVGEPIAPESHSRFSRSATRPRPPRPPTEAPF
jgi:hypothetical protein